MDTANHFPFRSTATFAWRSVLFFVLYSLTICALYAWAGWTFLAMPFVPIAAIGTAVAFYIGFKNNSSAKRLWESRRVWGELVNASRSWGVMVMDYVGNMDAPLCCSADELFRTQQMLIYRHVAYLNAVRIQVGGRHNCFDPSDSAEDLRGFQSQMDKELSMFLHDDEVEYFMARQNPAAQIIRRQSAQLRELRMAGLITEFYHSDMEHILSDLYAQQGAAERLKALPFLRQYAFNSYLFVCLFISILPFGLLTEMAKLSSWHIWLTVPFYTIIAWVFYTMELVSDTSENPFENNISDVPMKAICRSVEVDLREMLGEPSLPQKVQAAESILTPIKK